MKPTVQIRDAFISPGFGGNTVLMGYPVDYPADHMYYTGCVSNNKEITTSAIVARPDDSTVETKRTIYKVLNWRE